MAQAAASDDNRFDDLFDYDVDTEIPDLNVDLNPSKRGAEKSSSSRKVDLGIDEEVKIKRVRRPVVKLDAERLLSPKGLPQLRRIAPELLGKKLKGKGHEHKDAARILRFYQLWADDLYPKANFRDTMSIIEKLGHTKRVQVTRNQFLDEYRQQIVSPEDEMETKDVQQVEKAKATGSGGRGDDDDDDDDEDLYEPPPVPVTSSMTQEINNGGSLFLGGDDSENEEVGAQPDDSELEMLLHGETTEGTEPTAKGKEISSAVDEMFNDDDLEAMDDWDELMDRSNTGRKSNEVESSELQSHESRLGTAFKASIFGGGGMGHEQPGGASTAPHDDPDDEDALEAMYGF